MAAERIDMEIVTPERRVIAETVDEVTLPGREGYFGVLPGHAPLLTSLAVGELSFRTGDQTRFLAVSGGFVEVLGDRVSILAETAELAEEIDIERAKRAKERAEAELSKSDARFEAWAVKLQRAVTRIRVYGRRGRA